MRLWALVALATAPSHGCDDRSSRRWPLVAAVLLLLFAVLDDGTRATRLGDPGLWCRVPCTALGYPSALVGQSEERGDSFHVVRGQLLQHLFIMYPLAESSDDGSIRDTGYSSSYLGEEGDEGPESFPGLLPHCMEVSLHAMLLISAGEVRYEPLAELFPGVDRPRARFMSQVWAGPDKATWKYVAITMVSPPASVMAVTYTCKNSDGLDVPSYFSGRCGRNLDGQVAA
jgi:hypothetical protein